MEPAEENVFNFFSYIKKRHTGNGRDSLHSFQNRVIGIPRALTYYLHPELWEVFFSELGMKVTVSPETSSRFLEQASLISESEHCLPVKLLDAHVAWLAERTDAVFVPRILSLDAGLISCPKLSALPDTIRADFGEQVEVLTIEVDARREALEETLLQLGSRLGFNNRRSQTARDKALRAMQQADTPLRSSPATPDGHFLLLSHPYNVHTHYFTTPITEKLVSMGISVESVDFTRPVTGNGPVKWDTCCAMYELLEGLDPEQYDGVIQLTSFNCGCDSIVGTLYRDILRRKSVPLMALILDEHNSQAGIDTRLEAFVDSLKPVRADNMEHHGNR